MTVEHLGDGRVKFHPPEGLREEHFREGLRIVDLMPELSVTHAREYAERIAWSIQSAVDARAAPAPAWTREAPTERGAWWIYLPPHPAVHFVTVTPEGNVSGPPWGTVFTLTGLGAWWQRAEVPGAPQEGSEGSDASG